MSEWMGYREGAPQGLILYLQFHLKMKFGCESDRLASQGKISHNIEGSVTKEAATRSSKCRDASKKASPMVFH